MAGTLAAPLLMAFTASSYDGSWPSSIRTCKLIELQRNAWICSQKNLIRVFFQFLFSHIKDAFKDRIDDSAVAYRDIAVRTKVRFFSCPHFPNLSPPYKWAVHWLLPSSSQRVRTSPPASSASTTLLFSKIKYLIRKTFTYCSPQPWTHISSLSRFSGPCETNQNLETRTLIQHRSIAYRILP